MVLKLFWKDVDGNSYELGSLYKKDSLYCFDIVEKETLKKTTQARMFWNRRVKSFL